MEACAMAAAGSGARAHLGETRGLRHEAAPPGEWPARGPSARSRPTPPPRRHRHDRGSLYLLLALLAPTLAPAPAQADPYFWRDERGSMHSAERLSEVPATFREQALDNRRRQAPIETPAASDRGAGAAGGSSLSLPAPPSDATGQQSCEQARAIYEDLEAKLRTTPPRDRTKILLQANRLCPSDRAIAFLLKDGLERAVEGFEANGDYLSAAEAYSSLLELSPGNKQYRYARDVALCRAGRTEEIRGDLEALRDSGSRDFPLATYCLGKIALATGDEEKAERLMSEFLGESSSGHPAERKEAKDLVDRLGMEHDKAAKIARIEGGYEQAESDHFVFRWSPADRDDRPRDLVQTVEKSLEKAYRMVGADFGDFPQDKLTVVFYSPKDYAARFGMGGCWKAFYSPPDRSIRVKSSLETPKLLEPTLIHEYTHAVVHDLAGLRVMAWLNEGLAQLETRKAVYGPAQALSPPTTLFDEVRSAMKKNRYMVLSELERWDFSDAYKAVSQGADSPETLERMISLGYKEALAATCFLVSKIGMPGILRILRETKTGADPHTAFGLVYPLGTAGFEKEFAKYIESR